MDKMQQHSIHVYYWLRFLFHAFYLPYSSFMRKILDICHFASVNIYQLRKSKWICFLPPEMLLSVSQFSD